MKSLYSGIDVYYEKGVECETDFWKDNLPIIVNFKTNDNHHHPKNEDAHQL